MSQESLFVTVPETSLPNGIVVPSFQVGQYFCSKGEDGKATVSAAAKPWAYINFHDAKKACEDAGFKLITELQCLAIAHQVANCDLNWTGGKVGEGSLLQGLHNWTVRDAQPGTYEPTDTAERRCFALTNGDRICDVAGNIYTWVFDDVQGDQAGIVCKPFSDSTPSITTAPFPSMKKGMGWYPRAGDDWSGGALVRGGCWDSYGSAGVFHVDRGWPDNDYHSVGFRCTK